MKELRPCHDPGQYNKKKNEKRDILKTASPLRCNIIEKVMLIKMIIMALMVT